LDNTESRVVKSFDDLRAKLDKAAPKAIAVAAAHDKHTLEALFAAAKALPMRCIPVGDRQKILEIAAELGETIDAGSIIDCGDDADCARLAVSLVREGRANVLMKGILETGTLMKAVLDRETGIRDSGIMSHFAMLEIPAYHKVVIGTDGGILTNPTLEQKADIVRNAVSFCRKLGYGLPKIAALCASESVSDKMPETVDAAALQRMCENGELGDCLLEGPLSFDIAIDPESARVKGKASAITGDVDILLVPNITTGNVFVKGLLYWGGAKMAGCVIGARAPIVLLSRGASAEEKMLSILLCLAG